MDDLLKMIMKFVGEGQFLFLGRVSKRWHRVYIAVESLSSSSARQRSQAEEKGESKDEVRKSKVFDRKTDVKAAVESSKRLLAGLINGCKMDAKLFATCAGYGTLEACQLLRCLDCPWSDACCRQAAKHGHIHILRWLRSFDDPCPWNEATCEAAAYGGHLDTLKWLREAPDPCPWNEGTCALAARGGHLHILEWLKNSADSCPWGVRTCADAAQGGHVHVLEWLRQGPERCPWSERTCMFASLFGKLEALAWLRQGDDPCPWNEYACPAWVKREFPALWEQRDWPVIGNEGLYDAVVNWVHANGRPCDCPDLGWGKK
ncbi:unnamed protein product [Chrysoparadoxa australica]